MPVLYCTSTSNSDLIYHDIRIWEPDLGSEVGIETGWGTLYYAMKAVSDDNSPISLLTVDGIGEQYHVHSCRMGSLHRILLL